MLFNKFDVADFASSGAVVDSKLNALLAGLAHKFIAILALECTALNKLLLEGDGSFRPTILLWVHADLPGVACCRVLIPKDQEPLA